MPKNKSPLHNFPISTKPFILVEARECGGDIRNAHPSMIIKSQAQMNALGKLYDWRIIRRQYSGVSLRFLATNDSAIAPLVQRSLVERRPSNLLSLTALGRRVYDLNYHLTLWRLERRREAMAEKLAARQKIYYGGSLNNTDPPRWRLG